MADQINPTHYKKAPPGIEHECIDYTRHMSFNTGNAAKYAYRAGAKGHAEVDLLKCRWYLNDAVEIGDYDFTSSMMWNSVDPDATKRSRLFHYIVTGETVTALNYLDTLLLFPFRLDDPLENPS